MRSGRGGLDWRRETTGISLGKPSIPLPFSSFLPFVSQPRCPFRFTMWHPLNSEIQLQCELADARRHRCARDLTKSRHTVAESRVRIAKLRAVEGVKEFGAELKTHAFG